jgi:hypothetical protein
MPELPAHETIQRPPEGGEGRGGFHDQWLPAGEHAKR